MNSLYLHMFWPEEWPLVFIILCLFIIVLWTISLCIKLKNKIKVNIATIERLSKEEAIAYLENSLKLNNVDYNATFEKFETDNEKDANNEAVFEHIRSIYDAGRKSSRLDADLLVKNTVAKICDNVDTIKSCISIFLVIGILGTLVGLGISIGSFNGDSFIINAKANNTALELSKLFGNLRGAFAPSMWGVFMTIVFVIAFTVVIQQGGINKLEENLTTSTIKLWLPSLYPTDFQKGEATMVQLKDTIQNAEQINTGANKLVNNLNEANSTVQALTAVAEAVRASTDRFTESSSKVKELEAAISAITEQIKLNNEDYQNWMNRALENSQGYHEKVKDYFLAEADALKQNFSEQNKQLTTILNTSSDYHEKVKNHFLAEAEVLKQNFSEQNKQLITIVNALKLYDENSVKGQELLNATLNKAVSDNNAAIAKLNQIASDLDARDKNIISNVGEPLTKQLDEMGQRISGDLRNLTKAIDRIDDPLSKTAGDIQRMFKNILSSMNEIMAAKTGLTKEEMEILTSKASNSVTDITVDTSRLENRLEDILRCLENQSQYFNNKGEPRVIYADDTKYIDTNKGDFVHKNIVIIAIAALLSVSILIQGIMVIKLGNIQESQNQLYRIISESDLNKNKDLQQ